VTIAAPVFLPAIALDTERMMVERLDLRPLALPSELARAEGSWKGAPAVIETRAYAGGAVAYARFARVWQPGMVPGAGLEIGNYLVLGRPDLGLPVLGADLVGMGLRGRMLAADLSPVLPPGAARDRQLAPLADRAAARARLTPGGALPEWCARFFSPHALFVRPGVDELPAAVAELDEFPRVFVALVLDATSDGAASPARRAQSVHDEYLAAHRTDDKGLGMLARMFGDAWAQRYLDEVLFPLELPARRAVG
jgi:phycocyanobilin:ferredoxin oxidoreductase